MGLTSFHINQVMLSAVTAVYSICLDFFVPLVIDITNSTASTFFDDHSVYSTLLLRSALTSINTPTPELPA
jgi:hypothetical protein